MTAIIFETLKFAERLTKAGVPEAHAKAEAEALAEDLSGGAQELTTKSDLREAELRIDNKIEAATSDMIKWMFVFWVGTTVTIVGTIFGLVKPEYCVRSRAPFCNLYSTL